MKILRENKMQFMRCIAGAVLLCGARVPVAGQSAPLAENLAPNPGFEAAQAAGWNLPKPQFTLSDELPHAGTRCLRLENADPKKYLLATAHPKLMPGRSYAFEAWLRTQGVQGGDAGGATLCIEWSDAAGQFIGGAYPHGLHGTQTNWTRVEGLTGRVPTNAARFSLSCYMRRGVTGTAWWDDVAIREFRPPVIEALVTDRYRDQADSGRVTVHAGMALAENQLDAASVRLALTVLDPGGNGVTTGAAGQLDADAAAFTFDAAPLVPGVYTLRCTARNAAGAEVGHADLRFERVSAFPPRKAFIDEHRRLILDGQPFFPLGTYWSGAKADELELYAKSPFNCIMPYADIGRAGVDLAWSHGIRVIYSVKDLYPSLRKQLKTPAEAHALIAHKVAALKDHPGIIAWYINDELPLTLRDELVAHRQWLEELDPGRPTWAVLYQVDQLRGYVPTCDVLGSDPYPLGRKSPVMARDWARETRRASLGAHAVWMVPQIFDWVAYHEHGAQQLPHPPSLAEMRAMAWSCLAEGANGLIFYSWFDLWKMDKPKTVDGHTPAREPFDERWRDVTAMAAEIRDFVPVLLSIEPAPQPHVEAPPAFAWRALAKDGAMWLIAVNNDEHAAAPATFRFAAPFAKASARFPGAQPEGSGLEWKLTLPPLGVQIVKLEK
jgi:hypothetical protein